MLKFNNFPPEVAGDVELTNAGLKEYILGAEPFDTYDDSQKTYIDATVRCISRTLFTAIADKTSRDEIIKPVLEQIANGSSQEETAERFERFFIHAWDEQIREEGVSR